MILVTRNKKTNKMINSYLTCQRRSSRLYARGEVEELGDFESESDLIKFAIKR